MSPRNAAPRIVARPRTRIRWSLVLLLPGVLFACGGDKPEAANGGQDCNWTSSATDTQGDRACSIECRGSGLSAVCQGPHGQPASCFCAGSAQFGHLFAVDDCRRLDAQLLAAHCAVE